MQIARKVQLPARNVPSPAIARILTRCLAQKLLPVIVVSGTGGSGAAT